MYQKKSTTDLVGLCLLIVNLMTSVVLSDDCCARSDDLKYHRYSLGIIKCNSRDEVKDVIIYRQLLPTSKRIYFLYYRASCMKGDAVVSAMCNLGTAIEIRQRARGEEPYNLCIEGTVCEMTVESPGMCLKKVYLEKAGGIDDGRIWSTNDHDTSRRKRLRVECRLGYIDKDPGINTSCIKCPYGQYGYKCKKMCRCEEARRCDTATGECGTNITTNGVVVYCKDPLNYGYKCTNVCRFPNWGQGSWVGRKYIGACHRKCNCRDNKVCHSADGNCDGRCKPSYYGNKGDCSLKCADGKYGNLNDHGGTCHKDCNCLNNTACYGDGTCQKGLEIPCIKYGAGCTLKCHCLNGKECNPKTGECAYGCDIRHYNSDCQGNCPRGRFLLNGKCSGICHCKQDICNVTNGRCEKGCEQSYLGYNCQRRCNYGNKCKNAKKCYCLSDKQNCNETTGECLDGCAVRRMGYGCQQSCRDGWWGQGCNDKCLCKQDSQCVASNGTCLQGGSDRCPGGMYGIRCDLQCKHATSNFAECDKKMCKCFDPNECDLRTRKCSGKCKPRYTGGYDKRCTKSRCSKGSYLIAGQCKGTCQCLNLDLCSVTTGECVGGGCNAGWIAPKCTEKCYYGIGCPKPCQCARNETCNPTNGHCPNGCVRRNYGNDCQRSCTEGKFHKGSGSVCNGLCHCASTEMCIAATGKCLLGVCSKGWYGGSCQDRCKYGLHVDNCLKVCFCDSGDRCNRKTGGCPSGCAIRYYGDGCSMTCNPGVFLNDNKQCRKTCNCLNNLKCNVSSGVCVGGGCSIGWEGFNCQEKCKGKTYGRNCKNQCHCEYDSKCHVKTGACHKCHHRWYGAVCSKQCDEGRYLKHGQCTGECHCKDNLQCDVGRGRCLKGGCSIGWKGSNNLLCNEKCNNNKYGPSCNETCHCLDNEQCNHISGACDNGCDHRYTGDNCKSTCKRGVYMNDNGTCTEKCMCHTVKACRVTDGLCMQGGCKHNAATNQKQVCAEACTRGTYRLVDKGCDGKCHCFKNYTCDPLTGKCPTGCSVRYDGDICSETCNDITKYRDGAGDCTKICRCVNLDTCNVSSGACGLGGCDDGYEGPSCQEECSLNTYGKHCNKKCQCSNNDKCNHITGKCPRSCNTRHYGDFCHRTCPRNAYIKNGRCTGRCHCANPGKCKVNSGECGGSACRPGRKGPMCQFVCVRRFGFECKQKCNCLNNEPCDIESGRCDQCEHRYFGESCNQTCEFGKYSARENCNKTCRCFDNSGCDVNNGHCPDSRCMSVRYAGPSCQFTCNRGEYVTDITNLLCSGKCRCDIENQCNVLNGSCGGGQCKPGWVGEKCNNKCQSGKFGRRCSSTCHCKFGVPCEHEYGKCDSGCAPGYVGNNCQDKSDLAKSYEEIGIYTSVCLLFVVIAVIIGYIVALRRQRKRAQEVRVARRMISELGLNSSATSICSLANRRSFEQSSRNNILAENMSQSLKGTPSNQSYASRGEFNRSAGSKTSVGSKYAGSKTSVGSKYAGSKTSVGSKYAGSKTSVGSKYAGSKTSVGSKYAGSKTSVGSRIARSTKKRRKVVAGGLQSPKQSFNRISNKAREVVSKTKSERRTKSKRDNVSTNTRLKKRERDMRIEERRKDTLDKPRVSKTKGKYVDNELESTNKSDIDYTARIKGNMKEYKLTID